jgi:hypothetical protein
MRVGEHKEALVARVRVLSGVVGVFLAMIAGAFWFVQVVRGSYYRDLAENNRLRKVAIKAPRGTIYDRNGRVMVENLPSYNLLLDRSRSREYVSSLEFAAPILERPVAELQALVERYRGVPSLPAGAWARADARPGGALPGRAARPPRDSSSTSRTAASTGSASRRRTFSATSARPGRRSSPIR